MTGNLADIRRQVEEGKLVPIGREREAFIPRLPLGSRPKPGDIIAGPFVVVSVDPTPHPGGWDAKVRQLVPPRATRREK